MPTPPDMGSLPEHLKKLVDNAAIIYAAMKKHNLTREQVARLHPSQARLLVERGDVVYSEVAHLTPPHIALLTHRSDISVAQARSLDVFQADALMRRKDQAFDDRVMWLDPVKAGIFGRSFKVGETGTVRPSLEEVLTLTSDRLRLRYGEIEEPEEPEVSAFLTSASGASKTLKTRSSPYVP